MVTGAREPFHVRCLHAGTNSIFGSPAPLPLGDQVGRVGPFVLRPCLPGLTCCVEERVVVGVAVEVGAACVEPEPLRQPLAHVALRLGALVNLGAGDAPALACFLGGRAGVL